MFFEAVVCTFTIRYRVFFDAVVCILIYVEKLIFALFSLRFNYGVAPPGLGEGGILPGVPRRWCAASPPVTYGVASTRLFAYDDIYCRWLYCRQ